MAARRVTGIDLDEVLGGFVPAIALWHNATHGTELTADDFHSYKFCDVWGGTNEESVDKVHAFFDTEYFTGIAPVPGAREALEELKEDFDLVVITSRQHAIQDETRRWLDAHYPGIFRKVLFGNHWSKDCPDPTIMNASKRTKEEMCKEVGAVALVDDAVGYAFGCSSAVEKVILFGNYSWNQTDEPLPANVVRCADWAGAKAALAPLR